MTKNLIMIAVIVYVVTANYCKFKQTLGLETWDCRGTFVVTCESPDQKPVWRPR